MIMDVDVDDLQTIFLIVCIANSAVAYNCIEKNCVGGVCTPESECPVISTYGCMIARQAGNTIHRCADKICVPLWMNQNGTENTIDCCFTDKCNVDSMTSTEEDPNMSECYSSYCPTVGCLKDAISQGKARMCTKSSTGNCMYVAKKDGDQYFESAVCQEAVSTLSTCISGANYKIQDGSTTIVECCKEDLCNNGIKVKQPGVDYCYTINCVNAGCIEEAIANKAYVYCPQTGHGCMTTISSGSYATTCANNACASSDVGTFSIECCSGDLCNGPPASRTPSSIAASPTTELGTSFHMWTIFIFMAFIPLI